MKEKCTANSFAEVAELYHAGNGFYLGNPNNFDAKYDIDKKRFWYFLETTQNDELEKLK